MKSERTKKNRQFLIINLINQIVRQKWDINAEIEASYQFVQVIEKIGLDTPKGFMILEF